MHGLYSFAVITDDRELLLAASSEEEKYKWMEVRLKMVERQESRITDFFPSAYCRFRLRFGAEAGTVPTRFSKRNKCWPFAHSEVAREIVSVVCRIVLWDCLGYAIASFIGYYKVA